MPGRVPAGVRPTGAKVREALFSMVGQDLSGWTVLDAFGGSGLLAFEAASRGARVTVVEHRREVAGRIREAVRTLGVNEIDVRNEDAARVLGTGQWDLVLLDPPYADDPGPWVARGAAAAVRALVVEHGRRAVLPAGVGPLVLDRRRDYGDTSLSVYRPRPG